MLKEFSILYLHNQSNVKTLKILRIYSKFLNHNLYEFAVISKHFRKFAVPHTQVKDQLHHLIISEHHKCESYNIYYSLPTLKRFGLFTSKIGSVSVV